VLRATLKTVQPQKVTDSFFTRSPYTLGAVPGPKPGTAPNEEYFHFYGVVMYLCVVARILAIDYGSKRTGLAVTDPLQIIATGLETVATVALLDYLQAYLAREEVDTVVIGEPSHADGNPTQLVPHIRGFVRQLQKLYPALNIVLQDERFTSVLAKEAILKSGAKRKQRQDKGLVDKIAAVIILQEYLETHKYQ
jgi:putative holliday junction resolvase